MFRRYFSPPYPFASLSIYSLLQSCNLCLYHSCKMVVAISLAALLLALPQTGQAQSSSAPGVSVFTAPAGFPTALFSSYYVPPAPTQEPQPALYDPVLNTTFPLNLTDPHNIPDVDTDPVYYPTPVGNVSNGTLLIAAAITRIKGIIAGNGTNCTKCHEALRVGKDAARLVPSMIPDAMVALCKATKFASNASCEENYAAGSFGAVWTQIIALADVAGLDGQYICNNLNSKFCPTPYTLPSNVTFPKPKPSNAVAPASNGKRVKVLHMSDFHLDPRYGPGSEANCSSSLCCRYNVDNSASPNASLLPAPLYGAYACDTPYFLGTSALQAVGPLTGTNSSHPFAWSVYTGDLVSHDGQNQVKPRTGHLEYSADLNLTAVQSVH